MKIDPSKKLVALDQMGNKLLLRPPFLTETVITRAQATQIGAAGPSPTVAWTVAYELTTNGADALATETNRVLDFPAPRNQIATVINGVVVSAPISGLRFAAPAPPVSVNLLRIETTQGSVGAWHLEVSTFPDRIRSRKI